MVIPIYFLVQSSSPVGAWIIRTLATIYGFSSSLYIHIFPIIAGMIFDVYKSFKNRGAGEIETELVDSASQSGSGSGSGSDMNSSN